MKSITILIIAVSIASAILPERASAQGYVSFQVFYDELSPYGQWVDDPEYGYVWVPDAGPDFVPYSTAGHWIYTDYGWTWISDYNWGWAPFHYGRWNYSSDLEWFWVPGHEWGPAWVAWRSSDGYFGWAPLGPGVSINVVIGGSYRIPEDRWVFVRDRDFERDDVYRYHVRRSENVSIIRNSTIINNTYVDNSRHTTYIAGPRREVVQRATGREIRRVSVQERSRPGENLGNGHLQIYRPQVQKPGRTDRQPIPRRAVNARDYRRNPEGNATRRQETSQPNNRNVQPAQPHNQPENTRREQMNPAANRGNQENNLQQTNRPANNEREQQMRRENQSPANNRQSTQPQQHQQQNERRDVNRSPTPTNNHANPPVQQRRESPPPQTHQQNAHANPPPQRKEQSRPENNQNQRRGQPDQKQNERR